MKRRLIYNMVGVLAMLLMMGACQEEDWSNQVLDGNILTLELSTTAASRVPVVGDDRFNENEVERVDVYFFANGGSGFCLYAQTGLVPEGSMLQVVLDKTIIQDGSTYYIYVVANYDLGITNETVVNYTLDDLKDIIISTQWKGGINADDVVESSLVMDGSTSVEVTAEGTEGHVILTRAMAKVMLYTSTEEELIVNGMTYKPVPERMFVTMYNSVMKTNLGDDYQVDASADYLTGGIRRNYDAENPEEVPAKEIDEDADENAKPYNRYEQVAPFYSYPNPQETTDRKDTYLMLCVPWTVRQSDGDGSYQAVNYYYRVPITGNADPALMACNQYYRINVHISVLGSVDPEDAIEITNANFEIYDWFEVGIDTGMEQYQYLVLDEYSSVMNNVDELEMPYISSSPLTTQTRITSVTYPNYNTSDGRATTVTLRGDQITNNGFDIDWDSENLTFTHPVTSNDYVPYTITVEVRNNQGLDATWAIVQYPAIYIVGDYNQEGGQNRFVYGVQSGYVSDDSGNSLGNANDTDNATNRNLNQYTIYITSFDIEGSDYAIGDPRTSTVNNLGNSLENKTDKTGKKLSSYYPTREDDVANVIAPVFKIASSWGVVSTSNQYYDRWERIPRVLSYETAQRRCASYQENGYPAGRWRIPTEAEIEYIVGLSDRQVIPALFNGDYYASSGRYYDNGYDGGIRGFHSDTDTEVGHSVRCVYDVWYWGNDKLADPNVFTWGDEPMRYN